MADDKAEDTAGHGTCKVLDLTRNPEATEFPSRDATAKNLLDMILEDTTYPGLNLDGAGKTQQAFAMLKGDRLAVGVIGCDRPVYL
jgi:hypothetical protein